MFTSEKSPERPVTPAVPLHVSFTLYSPLGPNSQLSRAPHTKNSPVFTLEKLRNSCQDSSGESDSYPSNQISKCTIVLGLGQLLCSPGPERLA